MHIERLVDMANDIAAYFIPDPDAAVEGIAQHIRRFWDPRMRAQIIAYLEEGGEGLAPTAAEAIRIVAREARPPSPTAPHETRQA
jgi:formate dehydrogenase subunit delta